MAVNSAIRRQLLLPLHRLLLHRLLPMLHRPLRTLHRRLLLPLLSLCQCCLRNS